MGDTKKTIVKKGAVVDKRPWRPTFILHTTVVASGEKKGMDRMNRFMLCPIGALILTIQCEAEPEISETGVRRLPTSFRRPGKTGVDVIASAALHSLRT